MAYDLCMADLHRMGDAPPTARNPANTVNNVDDFILKRKVTVDTGDVSEK